MTLLVSKINQLGDSITFLPVVKELADRIYPERMTLLCSGFGHAVFDGTADNIDFFLFDRTRLKSPRSLSRFIGLWRKDHQRRHDKALFSYNEPTIAYTFAKLLGIRERIGFDSGIARGQSSLTDTIAFDPARDVVQSEFDLVRYVANDRSLMPRRIPIAYSDTVTRTITGRLEKTIGDVGQPFVIIHPEASLPYKMWGMDKYLDLARRIESDLDTRVMFVTHQERRFPGFCSLSNMTIKELACLFERACLFVGNNSGPMHIADTMGTTILSIRGPSPARWDPIWTAARSRSLAANHLPCVPCEKFDHQPRECLNTDYPMGCMREITVEQVTAQLADLMAMESDLSSGRESR